MNQLVNPRFRFPEGLIRQVARKADSVKRGRAYRLTWQTAFIAPSINPAPEPLHYHPDRGYWSGNRQLTFEGGSWEPIGHRPCTGEVDDDTARRVLSLAARGYPYFAVVDVHGPTRRLGWLVLLSPR